MTEPVVSQKKYLLVFLGLMGLTATTVAAYRGPLGIFHTPVALGIAAAKALLVVLFFMHLLRSSRLTWIVALSGLIWLVILIGLTMSDYVTRQTLRLLHPLRLGGWSS